MLLASAHASSNERPFTYDPSAPHAFARYVVQAFKPISHIHLALFTPGGTQDGRSATDDVLMTLHDVVTVPTIQDVVFDQDGSAHLRGRGAPGVTIALQSNGRRLAEGRVSKTGTWDITLDKHLTHGVHRVQSIAFRPGDDHHVRGADVRLALPQSLSMPTGEQAGSVTAIKDGQPLRFKTNADGGATSWHIAQVGDDQAREPSQRDQGFEDDEFAAPFFNWLRRSSEIYGEVIVPDLSGEERGLAFVHPGGRATVENRENFESQDEERRRQSARSERSWPETGIVDQLSARWQNFSTGLSDWFSQARQTYRAEIADELSIGAGRGRDVARRREQEDEDRVARTEADVRPAPAIELPERARQALPPSPPPEPQHEPAPEVRDETPAIEPRAKLEEWPVVDVTPREQTPTPAQPTPSRSFEWPVVTENEVKPEPLPEVKPDPNNEALIRQAEEDAARARELARQAAERAEQTRRETEALLEEERRLNEEMAKRAAAEKAAREEALQKRLSQADERAADARRQAAETAEAERQRAQQERARAEAEAAERARAEAEDAERARVAAEAERVRQDAQRRAAEALAAAATEEADEKFRSGEVLEPGDVAPAKPRQDFTVAEAPPPRGSLKDTARDADVEEGSTLGDVDDFDPSVRYVYDMGDAAPAAKVKRKKRKYKRAYRKRSAKRRAYKKRRAKRRGYRARKYKKRRARARRGYKSRRSYRLRRYSYRRRFIRHRMSLGTRRFLRAFTRGVRVKARRRCGRRHAMRRKIYMSRARWRRR